MFPALASGSSLCTQPRPATGSDTVGAGAAAGDAVDGTDEAAGVGVEAAAGTESPQKLRCSAAGAAQGAAGDAHAAGEHLGANGARELQQELESAAAGGQGAANTARPDGSRPEPAERGQLLQELKHPAAGTEGPAGAAPAHAHSAGPAVSRPEAAAGGGEGVAKAAPAEANSPGPAAGGELPEKLGHPAAAPEGDNPGPAAGLGLQEGGLQKLLRHVEFYFSDENLPTDAFLLKQLARSPEGWGEAYQGLQGLHVGSKG